ncbi:rod shape-determining protein MreC [Candidatus Pelagibacter sp.]|jgi:rod shape-determining protein MreC|nr:rod shape-determining protein MreC [Candidatus Pelagibacter sp.]
METSRDDFIIAIRSAFLKKGTQQRFSLLSLILFSIIFLILGNLNLRLIEFNKSIIKEVVYYSSFIVTIPENIVKKSFNKVSDHFEHYDKYTVIQNELQELENKDLSKKIITYENVELKRLIEDYFVVDSQVFTKVLADKKSPFLKSIIINKGSKNGIRIGMIVQDDDYLIGRVVEVNFLTARVLLISDINSKVPVTIQPLNIQAIMSGLEEQKGKLQYVKDEKLIKNLDKELIVVTSGSGGIFKSGIPIGKVNLKDSLNKSEIIVDFFKDFSQLKYLKVLSYKQEEIQLDKVNKKIFKKNDEIISNINNLQADIKIFQKQNIISEEIRNKLEEENARLNKKLINTQKQIEEINKKEKKVKIENEEIKFLKLNLLYGHKCRRTFLKTKLYKINSPGYRVCVLNKGIIKKN